MQFLLFKSKKPINIGMKEKIKKAFYERTSVLCPHNDYEWSSDDDTLFFIGRNPDLPIYELYNTFNISDTNDLTFIHGWLKKSSEDCLLDANSLNSIDDELALDGFYVAGKFQRNGEGEFYSSSMFPDVYYAADDESFAVSNRISMLSKVFNYETPNKKHLASHIEYQNGPLTFDTMFEKVYWIPFGTKIKIDNGELCFKKDHDYLYDESLNRKYLENRDEYWDELYEKAVSQVKAFVNLGVADYLSLGISGGVDSRLTLSLFYPYLGSVFTKGPAYSPEVIVGRMVADTLGISHSSPNIREINRPKMGSDKQNLLKSLPNHLFVREFEMSPWDFGWIKEKTYPVIGIDGQEFIRNVPYEEDMDIEEIIKASRIKFSKVKSLKSINNKFYEDIFTENENIMREYLNDMHDIRKFAVIEKMLSRGRWRSRVHETVFDFSFNIYPLLTNSFLKYTYNASAESILNQEVVIEIFKRANPDLLDVPLFNKQFSQNPVPAIENKIPGKLNYKNLYLIENFDYLIGFILDNFDLVSDIVSEDFIHSLSPEKFEGNAQYPQIAYNILQAIVLLKVEDYSLLKEMLDIDMDVKEEETEDTYDEDCISAFVQYNRDIVKLKQENIELNEKIKELNIQIDNINKQPGLVRKIKKLLR
ncbi:hypothetical protein [Methanobrevibacter sp.]|uniref:hypothetical protein n=1 Tax=Methanobrevibacter sp. TaxID=66852 RepID=UPI00388F0D1B